MNKFWAPLSVSGDSSARRLLKRRRFNRAFVAVLATGSLGLLAAGQMQAADADNADARQTGQVEEHYLHQVETYPLVFSDAYQVKRRYSGKLVAAQNSDLGFELAGKLNEILYKEGSRVQKGDTVAALDTELLQIEKQQLQAQLEETRAQLALNETNIRRQKSLRKGGFASEQRLDELDAEHKSLKAGIKRIQASIAGVELRIRKSSLKAPFDGIVSRRFVDEGTVVNAGAPVVRLQQVGGMELEVGVPVRLASQMALNKVYSVNVYGHLGSARLIALGADVDNVTRTVSARFDVTEMDAAFHGALAQVQIEESIPSQGFWIPASAVTDGVRGLWVVYVAKPLGNNQFEIESRDVQIVHATDADVFVRGALSPGEVVVASGLHRLVSGQKVRGAPSAASVLNQPQSSL